MKSYPPNYRGHLYPYDPLASEPSLEHKIDFMFNPSEIQEQRSVAYNFSEGQGQALPLAQYGRIGNTEIMFKLFLFDHRGVGEQFKRLRRTTSPRSTRALNYYSQAMPYTYLLSLGAYGSFVGVVQKLNMVTKQYSRRDMTPIHVEANVTFIPISMGYKSDLGLDV